MKIGYARVSTKEQNLGRQIDDLEKHGCEIIFQEKITGRKKVRPELEQLFAVLKAGDVVVVSELSRLSRTMKDLFSIVDRIEACGAEFMSLKETLIDTTSPYGKLIFHLMAVLAEFERNLTVLNTLEGLESARARGHFGGRPPKSGQEIALALRMYKDKNYSLSEIQQAASIGKNSLYKYLRLKAIELSEQGCSFEQILSETGLSAHLLSKFLQV